MNKILRYYNVACWNTSDTAHWQEAKDNEAAIEIHKTEMADCATGFRSGVYKSHREMTGWHDCWTPGNPATPTGVWIVPMTEKK